MCNYFLSAKNFNRCAIELASRTRLSAGRSIRNRATPCSAGAGNGTTSGGGGRFCILDGFNPQGRKPFNLPSRNR